MDEAMRRVFPDVPAEIEFTYNGKRLQRHLFLYVLRHTFWRPRDILIYYSRIIELARETSRRRDHVAGRGAGGHRRPARHHHGSRQWSADRAGVRPGAQHLADSAVAGEYARARGQ
jgi:hypothetical protein